MNLNDLVPEATELAHAEAAAHAVEIRLELDDAVGLLSADSVQITQVVLNLLRNAIDAMGDTEPARREVVIQTKLVKDHQVEIAVCDTGKEIPGRDIERMFEPFFTTKPDGMEIGLSLSRSLVEAHGGRLWATSDPDRGMTLWFTLPTAGDSEHEQ